MLVDMFSLVNVVLPTMGPGSSSLTPYIRETFESYLPTLGVGVAGAVASWIIYRKSDFQASWYLRGARILGWLWVTVVPVGVLLGIGMLGAR